MFGLIICGVVGAEDGEAGCEETGDSSSGGSVVAAAATAAGAAAGMV